MGLATVYTVAASGSEVSSDRRSTGRDIFLILDGAIASLSQGGAADDDGDGDGDDDFHGDYDDGDGDDDDDVDGGCVDGYVVWKTMVVLMTLTVG